MTGGTQVRIRGEELALLPGRAAFWPAESTLLVADAHIGKASSFRAAGVPVPGGTTSEALSRLTRLLEDTGARRLIFLGDLFHAREGHAADTRDAMAAWRERHGQVDVALVRGNHDRGAGDPDPRLGIRCVDPPVTVGPFALRHHPQPADGLYALAGHLHPAVRMVGRGRQSRRLPCFWFGAEVGVLPAFGGFTGTAEVRPAPGDRVFVVAADQVVRVA